MTRANGGTAVRGPETPGEGSQHTGLGRERGHTRNLTSSRVSKGERRVCPEGHLLLKQAVGSSGSEVHTGTREAKGQAHRACNRTGGSEIRAGFLAETAARLSPHRKARAKSRGSLPAWAQRRLGGGDGRGVGTRLGGGVGGGKPSLLALGCLPSLCLREGGWAAGPQKSRLQTKRKGWLPASATSGRHNPSCSGHTRPRIRISRLWPCLISLIKPKVAAWHFGFKKKKIKAHPASSRRAGQRSPWGLPEEPSSLPALHTGAVTHLQGQLSGGARRRQGR